MALFKKKKDEDYEDEYDDEEEEEEPRRPLRRKFTKSKDFKDLNPSDKKKRKEPPKPWGKKERFLVLVLILLTAGTSGYLALTARDWKLPGLPRIEMPVLSNLNPFKEETIVIEGNNMEKQKSERAVNEFTKIAENLSGVYGLYVIRLKDGSNYGVNENKKFQAASLIKLPVMVGMYMEEEEGRLNLNNKYKLRNSDKVAGAGSLYSKPAGYEITYRNLIRLMGSQSDNTAFNIARKLLGDEKVAEITTNMGMKNTNIEDNETSPEDIGVLFEELWNARLQSPERPPATRGEALRAGSDGGQGNIITKEHAEELLEFLTNTSYENWISAGIPEGIRIAHKYGREVHTVNDAGIIFAKDPFIMVILSKGVVEREADNVFPELAGVIYSVETDY
jgi:beta-lactamase class A